MVVPACNPTNNEGVFLFLHILTSMAVTIFKYLKIHYCQRPASPWRGLFESSGKMTQSQADGMFSAQESFPDSPLLPEKNSKNSLDSSSLANQKTSLLFTYRFRHLLQVPF
ncbi:acyl-Coenzyme A dehydrogenase family, member 9, isoform CRA_f [Rattus norvegicus]|uniref:Acyl-Coenzyme A dehydrogenase family, member 9, isoform CRA_f n=1 Tax=Rattus norvegicus TaxID=10116 RepID=A6IHW8_RAT|nr:acyl-Coenzyme A dehydrogenase family, member 9, isoform CRA_f [Rattus norvegicus]